MASDSIAPRRSLHLQGRAVSIYKSRANLRSNRSAHRSDQTYEILRRLSKRLPRPCGADANHYLLSFVH